MTGRDVTMSTEKLAETVGRLADRRRLLKRAGTVGLGALGFFGLQTAFAESAYAWTGHGCHLCNTPTSSCGPALECAWCWMGDCRYDSGVGNVRHNCCEGYRAGSSCSGGCPAYCSWYTGNYSC